MSSRLPAMTVSKLLKSCAIPPVSWPTASILRLDKRRLGALTLGHLLHQQVVGSGEFVGALADATLEGCVEQPQPLLRRAKLFQLAPRLVLAAASAQGGSGGAGQGLAVYRPLQHYDVAKLCEDVRRLPVPPAGALGRQKNEREIGPSRLGGEPLRQRPAVGLGK